MLKKNYKEKYLKYKKKYNKLKENIKSSNILNTGGKTIDVSNDDLAKIEYMKFDNILASISKICKYFKYPILGVFEYDVKKVIKLLKLDREFNNKLYEITRRPKNKNSNDYIYKKIALKIIVYDKYFEKRYLIKDILDNLEDLYYNELYYILGDIKNRPLQKLKFIFSLIKKASPNDTYNIFIKKNIQCDRIDWMKKSLNYLNNLNLDCNNNIDQSNNYIDQNNINENIVPPDYEEEDNDKKV